MAQNLNGIVLSLCSQQLGSVMTQQRFLRPTVHRSCPNGESKSHGRAGEIRRIVSPQQASWPGNHTEISDQPQRGNAGSFSA